MKHLVLIRHAKSSWDHPNLTDLQRPLNNRGKHDAPLMGKRLKEMGVLPDFIISSPAVRAHKTAKKIAKQTDYPKKKISLCKELYLNGIHAMFKQITSLDEKYNTVYLVGHNPDITSLAYFLTKHRVDNIPTCGIFYVTFESLFWQDITESSGKFKLFDFPKNQKNL